MTATPTIEPAKITAGDTVTWQKSLSGYPAPTWVLSYALVKQGQQIEITAAASGTDHLVTIDGTTSGAFLVGTYRWQAYVTSGSERHTLETGALTVRANFADQDSGLDDRSHAEKVLEALEAMIEGRASKAKASYTIRGRSLQYLTPAELITWRSFYKREALGERRARRIKKGLGHSGIINVRL